MTRTVSSEQPAESTAIARRVSLDGSLELVREPAETLAEARKAADALMTVISRKPKKLMFNNEQYLEVDDWETIGAFHGCTADIESTSPVQFMGKDGNAIMGWEARAVLLDRSGRALSHAEAMCLDDEDKWSARPKYAWLYVTKDGRKVEEDPGKDQIIWVPKKGGGGNVPKKERTLVGTESVPSFQLRSMAQTRAIAKVHSNVFRWVATLAGYKGTPAEELPVEVVDRDEVVNHETGEVTTRNPASGNETPEQSHAEKIARIKREAGRLTDAPKQTAIAINAPVLVSEIEIKQGPDSMKDGKKISGWILYIIKFNGDVVASDGTVVREATTFSATIGLDAENARDSETPVLPVIKAGETKKGKPSYTLEALDLPLDR